MRQLSFITGATSWAVDQPKTNRDLAWSWITHATGFLGIQFFGSTLHTRCLNHQTKFGRLIPTTSAAAKLNLFTLSPLPAMYLVPPPACEHQGLGKFPCSSPLMLCEFLGLTCQVITWRSARSLSESDHFWLQYSASIPSTYDDQPGRLKHPGGDPFRQIFPIQRPAQQQQTCHATHVLSSPVLASFPLPLSSHF